MPSHAGLKIDIVGRQLAKLTANIPLPSDILLHLFTLLLAVTLSFRRMNLVKALASCAGCRSSHFVAKNQMRRVVPIDEFSKMEVYKDNPKWPKKASKPLRVLTMDAGIAGLTAAVSMRRD
jgi:hypothetical protein